MRSRRRFLAAGAALLLVRDLLAAGKIEKGVHQVEGEARINGTPARPGADVKAGDVVTTGVKSRIVFVVNRDAFLMRSNSRLEVGGAAADVFRIVTGALLSVFQPGVRKTVRAANATIGIRGTALYIESHSDKTYVCTCYGESRIEPTDDPAQAETVRTRHHEQPRYVYAKGATRMMSDAPVLNHTDYELGMLEGLVGRAVPFDPFLKDY